MWLSPKIICIVAVSSACGALGNLSETLDEKHMWEKLPPNVQQHIHQGTQPRHLEWICSAENPCQNGGTCLDDGACKCPDNYKGADCGKLVQCYSDCMSKMDAFAKSLNDPVVCKSATGTVVPCQEIRVFIPFPISGGQNLAPLASDYYRLSHIINKDQLVLPGYKIALTFADIGTSLGGAESNDIEKNKWSVPFRELLDRGGRNAFAGVLTVTTPDSTVMSTSLSKIARLPTVTCADSDVMDDPTQNPFVNMYFGNIANLFMTYEKLFQRFNWTRFGLLHEFEFAVPLFKAQAKLRGFTVPEEATYHVESADYQSSEPGTIKSAWEKLEKSRVRVIFVSGHSQQWVVNFLCMVTARGVRGLTFLIYNNLSPTERTFETHGQLCKDLGVTKEDRKATYNIWNGGTIPLFAGLPDDSYKLDCYPNHKVSDLNKVLMEDYDRHLLEPLFFPEARTGGLASDVMCVLIQAFRKHLVIDGRPLADLYNQDSATFEKMISNIRNSQFNGITGQPVAFHGTNNHKHDFLIFMNEELFGRYYGQKETFDELGVVKWPDGTEGYDNAPPDTYVACADGEVRRGTGCAGCEPGTYYFGGSCLDCPAGTAAETAGLTSCSVCQAGSFSKKKSSSCESCPEGTTPGKASQEACPCALGWFGEEGTNCTRCPDPHHTTAYLAAESWSDCLCQAEFYLKPGHGCVECGTGLECDISNSPPTQKAGYSIEVINAEKREYSVYECFNDKSACPAGELGGCSGGAFGQMCLQCPMEPDRMYWSKAAHRCERCDDSGGGAWVLPVALLCLAAVMSVMYFLALPRPGNEMASATVELVTTAALLLLAFQTGSVYSRLEINWGQPIDAILNFCSILALDFGFLHLDCVVGATYQSVFVLGTCFPATFALTYGLVGLVLYKLGKEDAPLRCWNAVGQVIQGFFTSFLLHGVKPFLVVAHPNGKESMKSGPEVMTGSPEHEGLAACGVLHLVLYGGGFLTFCVYACWQLRKRMSEKNTGTTSVRAVLWYHFFFFKFKPNRYFFGVIMLLRSATIVLTPVIFPTPHYQIMALQFVLCLYMVVQVLLWPYRFELHNYADIATSAAMIALTTAGAFFLPTEEADMSSVVQPVIVLFVMCSLVYLFVLGFPFWRIARKLCMSKDDLQKLEDAERKDRGAFLAELQNMEKQNLQILQKMDQKVDVEAVCQKPLMDISIGNILSYKVGQSGEIQEFLAPSQHRDMKEVQTCLDVLEAKLIHRAHELAEASAKKAGKTARASWNEHEQKQVRDLIVRVQTFFPIYSQTLLADTEVIKQLNRYVVQMEQQFKGVYTACVRDILQTQPGFDDVLRLAQALKRAAEEEKLEPSPSWEGQHLELMSSAAYAQEDVLLYVKSLATATQGTAPWCAMKHLYRILEKQALDPATTASPVRDSARSMIVYDSMQSFLNGLQKLRDDHQQKKIHIRRVKERFTEPTDGGWSDVLINFEFPAQPGQPDPLVCEIQMVHERMLILRKDLGGHDGYAKYRAAREILDLHQGTKPSAPKEGPAILPVVLPNCLPDGMEGG